MKILMSWLFDHIAAKKSDISIEELVAKFNKTTAEIEHFYNIDVPVEQIVVVQITQLQEKYAIAKNVISGEEVIIPLREAIAINQLYIMVHEHSTYRFATMVDLGGTKEHILPHIFIDKESYHCIPELLTQKDVIIDIDNKSITHRPDLWSHRGIAREIAAMFDMTLKEIDSFLVPCKVKHAETQLPATENNPFSIAIEDIEHCNRFAGLYIDTVSYQPSSLWMVIRLARLDCKPINALVDTTNYVLFDIGQPMHVFDANKLSQKRIIIRKADEKETLETLDDEKSELTKNDIIIADGMHAVSLAGIMGGKETAVTHETEAIFLEAAHFDATIIRRSALKHKKRTESSIRFEKNIDPLQNTTAIFRYLQLLDRMGIAYTFAGSVQSVGTMPTVVEIEITHTLIEKRLGVVISTQKVVSILQKLSFQVKKNEVEGKVIYIVTPPSFRATKDIHIPEDIIEEIGRFIGYETIEPILPCISLKPRDLTVTNRRREIKKILSFTACMKELYTYAFFNESFLSYINWSPKHCLDIKNPVSQNYVRLVTTLLPNLLQALQENAEQQKQIRFYEWGRVWLKNNEKVQEKQVISGVMYDHYNALDFYTGKAEVQNMYDVYNMQVCYTAIDSVEYPWIHPYQSAHVVHEDRIIGTIGMITKNIVETITPGGAIFFFEIDADAITHYNKPLVQYSTIAKYPPVIRDISVLLPVEKKTQEVQKMISNSDSRIVDVALIDFFQKNEWQEKRSVTMRIIIQDEKKTLTSHDADEVCSLVYDLLASLGAEVR